MRLVVNNSFCLVEEAPAEVGEAIKKILTYQNDVGAEKAQVFYQMKMAKRYNNRKQYAMCMKKLKAIEANEWVCWYRDNAFPTGHLNIVKDLLGALKQKYDIVDERDVPGPSLILNWNNKPYEPRYYQKEMIELGLKTGRGVFESAVGTGKSLVMTYLIKELSVNSLVVVPSRGLLQQLYEDFSVWFGKGKVQMIDSAKVRRGSSLKPIRITTIQSLAALQKSGDLENLMSDVEALFLDEFHHAGSASYTNLLDSIDHIYYRFGFTGTFLRNDSKSLDMWGFLSNKLYSYPAWKAIEEGFLTPIQVKVHELGGIKSRNYQKEYDANYCGAGELLERVLDIVTSAGDSEQILILVSKKDKAGKIIHELLNNYNIDNAYISGDDKKEVINKTIEAFNEKEVKVLIGSSVIGEGIDVRSTDHLIMCQGGKSEIVVVQATGRAVRLYPGKKVATVHDFHFTNTKYMEKHFKQRLNIYERNFQPKFLEV